MKLRSEDNSPICPDAIGYITDDHVYPDAIGYITDDHVYPDAIGYVTGVHAYPDDISSTPLPDDSHRICIPVYIGKGNPEFWNFKGRYRVVKGSRASKRAKPPPCSLFTKYTQANLLVVRKTYLTLKDSCYKELKWASNRLQVDHLWAFNQGHLEATYLPNGQNIYFRGLDDPLKKPWFAREI